MRDGTAAYTAAAVLSAFALVYILGPSIYPISDDGVSYKPSAAIGLSNSGNECFINSVLQALGGLSSLRRDPRQCSNSIRAAPVTDALTVLLNRLNEKVATKKTISSKEFIQVMEHAFGHKLSRQQQDAHEFCQVLLERLCEEHNGQYKGLESNKDRNSNSNNDNQEFGLAKSTPIQGLGLESDATSSKRPDSSVVAQDKPAFSFQGVLSSQIECLTCGFKPKPNTSSFVILPLNVPQENSADLNSCFDQLLKEEYIDDYYCEGCHKQNRRISKYSRISTYPQILVIHLSRSVFGGNSGALKNKARVAFSEKLYIGGLDRKLYILSAIITHLGSRHDSGHYETVRRQALRTLNTRPNFMEGKDKNDLDNSNNMSRDACGTDNIDATSRDSLKLTKKSSKWLCISDEKVRECTRRQMLEMQSDVYLLFYERIQ